MSLGDAVRYQPTQNTYALRIFSSWGGDSFRKPLEYSPLYRNTPGYVFDDIALEKERFFWGEKGVLFDEDMAKGVIRDFEIGRKECECLLVHCILGRNRSPAVAIALNEIFDLGHDGSLLKKEIS